MEIIIILVDFLLALFVTILDLIFSDIHFQTLWEGLAAISTTLAVMLALGLPYMEKYRLRKRIVLGLIDELVNNIENLKSELVEVVIQQDQYKRFNDNLDMFNLDNSNLIRTRLNLFYTHMRHYEHVWKSYNINHYYVLEKKFQVLVYFLYFLKVIDNLDLINEVSFIMVNNPDEKSFKSKFPKSKLVVNNFEFDVNLVIYLHDLQSTYRELLKGVYIHDEFPREHLFDKKNDILRVYIKYLEEIYSRRNFRKLLSDNLKSLTI